MLTPPPLRSLFSLIALLSAMSGMTQHTEKVLFSFTGYYESVMGTVSYVESVVHWSYLFERETDEVKGLRLAVPQEGFTSDFEITELWGNDEAVMFICGETAILVLKKFSKEEVGPIVSISKVAELDIPRHRRSYCRYFAVEDFQDLSDSAPSTSN